MTTVTVNIENLSDAQKFLSLVKNMNFVKSAEIVNYNHQLNDNDWVISGRPATDDEIESMISEAEQDISNGKIYSLEEAKKTTTATFAKAIN
jgi:hypothetical protein